MKVRAYRNLHAQRWSVLAMEGEHKGRVIAHAGSVLLKDVTPVVSEAGRQRVLRGARKHVHAYLEGTLVCWWYPEYRYLGDWEKYRAITTGTFDISTMSRVTYNPYRSRYFTCAEDSQCVLQEAGEALLLRTGRVFVGFGSQWADKEDLDQLSLDLRVA